MPVPLNTHAPYLKEVKEFFAAQHMNKRRERIGRVNTVVAAAVMRFNGEFRIGSTAGNARKGTNLSGLRNARLGSNPGRRYSLSHSRRRS